MHPCMKEGRKDRKKVGPSNAINKYESLHSSLNVLGRSPGMPACIDDWPFGESRAQAGVGQGALSRAHGCSSCLQGAFARRPSSPRPLCSCRRSGAFARRRK